MKNVEFIRGEIPQIFSIPAKYIRTVQINKNGNNPTMYIVQALKISAMRILITNYTRNFLADTGIFETLFRGQFKIVSYIIIESNRAAKLINLKMGGKAGAQFIFT